MTDQETPQVNEAQPDETMLHEIASGIAERLFRNGFGEDAQRLVLELPEGRNGGGWCKGAVRDVVLDGLNDAVRDGKLSATSANTN